MARRPNMIKTAERYAEYLLWDATDGAMGRSPPKKVGAEEKDYKVDFGTKRALLDSMIKLISMKNKVDPDEDEDGVETYREMLNGGTTTDRGTTPETSLGASILNGSTTNGHDKTDDLIE